VGVMQAVGEKVRVGEPEVLDVKVNTLPVEDTVGEREPVYVPLPVKEPLLEGVVVEEIESLREFVGVLEEVGDNVAQVEAEGEPELELRAVAERLKVGDAE
jgi:hypothetical protein